MTALVAVLVAVLVVAAVLSLALAGRSPAARLAAFVTVGTLAFLGLLAVIGGTEAPPGGLVAKTLLVDLFVVAVLGGSPVTATVLWLVDRGSRRDDMDDASEVLRGGAWIGGFERAAVFASLAAGWPEGLAVVLALKGLGRYSELRSSAATPAGPPLTGGVAERFIIGTFASVLWACACAATYLSLLTRGLG